MLLISAAAVFAVVYHETGTQLSDEIDHEVKSDTFEMVQGLKAINARTPAELERGAREYVDSQGYTGASPLLFAVITGQPTVSNHNEVFGAGDPDPHETAADQTRENAEGRELMHTRTGYSVHRVPDAGRVRVYAERLQLAGVAVLVGTGESLALVDRAQHGVARTFVLAGALALLIALVASYLAGARVSAPLRRMAAVAARVDAGDLGPRMPTAPARADEVQVLAEAFNHMLDRLAEAFAAQRAFIADASHELRTPLTVIRGQLEVLAAETNPSLDDIRRVEALVGAEISRTSRLVDDLLLLTRAERTDFLHLADVDVRTFVGDLWEGLASTAPRRFEVGPVPEGILHSDPDRLAQALRNLASNSIAHTAERSGLVRLEVQALDGGQIRFAVVDDGPGIPPDEREQVFERFHRVDAGRARVRGGTGLGLAIVRAIVEAHGGYVRATGRQNQPGARLEIILPGFLPRDRRRDPAGRAADPDARRRSGH